MKAILLFSLLFGQLFGFAALASDFEPRKCEDIVEVIIEFRYVLAVGGSELSEDQQLIAQEFIALLDQKIGPEVICMHTPPGGSEPESNELTLLAPNKVISGKMTFDEIGQIDNLVFRKARAHQRVTR